LYLAIVIIIVLSAFAKKKKRLRRGEESSRFTVKSLVNTHQRVVEEEGASQEEINSIGHRGPQKRIFEGE
jgi:hypothetical protein